MTKNNPGYWLQTFSQGAFHYLDPLNSKSFIDINDIARSLALLPRFLGHSEKFLSVAEHSCAVAYICKHEHSFSPKETLLALLHDAHEAYTGDIPSPFLRYLKDFKGFDILEVQEQIQQRILEHFGLEPHDTLLKALIARADLIALDTERRLYCNSTLDWGLPVYHTKQDYRSFYKPLPPSEAFKNFLEFVDILTESPDATN